MPCKSGYTKINYWFCYVHAVHPFQSQLREISKCEPTANDWWFNTIALVLVTAPPPMQLI